jgi:hypothetical protein
MAVSELLFCNGLGLAQIHSSTSWDSSCTVIYICSQPTSDSQFSAVLLFLYRYIFKLSLAIQFSVWAKMMKW